MLEKSHHTLRLPNDPSGELGAFAGRRRSHPDAVDEENWPPLRNSSHELEVGVGPVVIPPILSRKADPAWVVLQEFLNQ